MEKKKRLRLKTEKIDGEEMVVMECATCHRRENVEADIAFECWEFDGGPFPVFDCPFCETGMMIPKQEIELASTLRTQLLRRGNLAHELIP